MSQREHSLPLIWHRMHAGCYYSNTVTGVGSYRIERSFQGGGVALWDLWHTPAKQFTRKRLGLANGDPALSYAEGKATCAKHAEQLANDRPSRQSLRRADQPAGGSCSSPGIQN